MHSDGPATGWSLVATRDEAAQLLAGLVDLEADAVYAKSELAEASGVPMKTLYLTEFLADLEDLGVLARVESGDDDAETEFRLRGDSDVLAAAREFDRAVAAAQAPSE